MKKSILFLLWVFLSATTFAQTTSSFDQDVFAAVDKSGQVGLGFCIGGGGIIGVPFRYHVGSRTALEIGPYYRPVLYLDFNDEIVTKGSLMLAGGLQLMGNPREKAHRGRINFNGLMLKAGHSFGAFSESILAAGWAFETFKKESTNRSFLFELGGGVRLSHWPGAASPTGPLIYWKVHWNWFLKG